MRDKVLPKLRCTGFGIVLLGIALSVVSCGGGSVAARAGADAGKSAASHTAASAADDAARAGSAATDAGSVSPRLHEDLPSVPRSGSGGAVESSAESEADAPADVLNRMIYGPEREWTCHLIDLGIALQDGDVSRQEVATKAAQEVAGTVPSSRQVQARLAVQKLMESDPSALQDLACLAP